MVCTFIMLLQNKKENIGSYNTSLFHDKKTHQIFNYLKSIRYMSLIGDIKNRECWHLPTNKIIFLYFILLAVIILCI